jgi:uncharacterized protein YegL
MSDIPTTHLYVLLDRSGSMSTMVNDVVGGFNGLLAEQQAATGQARMTLVQFDSENPQEVLTDAVPVAEVTRITTATFSPRGGTPLLDATGLLIARATGRAEQRKILGQPAEQVLFITITDGEENQSREYDLTTVRKLVSNRQEAGWTFVYLGAGLHAYADAARMGYDARSVQAWAPDAAGATVAFESLSRKTANFRTRVASAAPMDTGDFWEGEKDAEEDKRRRA